MNDSVVLNSVYASTRYGLRGLESTFASEIDIKTQRNSLNIKTGQKFLLLGGPDKNNFKFTQYGKIEKLSDPIKAPLSEEERRKNDKLRAQNLPLPPPKYLYTVEVSPENLLTENNSVFDLTYSLSTINGYRKPQKHFQKQVRLLEDIDYETVVKGQIYLARTAFGRIANSLPKQNRYELTLLSMKEFNTTSLIGIDYVKALKILFDYIEYKILNPGKFLIKSDLLLEKTFKNSDTAYKKIGFYDTDKEMLDSVHTQANIFRELFKETNPQELLSEILNEIERNSESEKRFKSIFDKTRWPVLTE